jgi:predicted Rossmann fold nucleotide-binding protein DprA/Smf involved in DNA uptake
MNNLKFFGNQKLLKVHKTAFLCSKKCPSDIILKSLDWAKGKKDKGECVISGFHSQIEKDVFTILLKGNQPIVLVLARGMKKRWSKDIKEATESNRLLIISPFDESVKYITQKTANRRNEIMADLADEIFLAYYTKGGNLHNLMKKVLQKAKMEDGKMVSNLE